MSRLYVLTGKKIQYTVVKAQAGECSVGKNLTGRDEIEMATGCLIVFLSLERCNAR